jgi:hypothetical protein
MIAVKCFGASIRRQFLGLQTSCLRTPASAGFYQIAPLDILVSDVEKNIQAHRGTATEL